MGISSYCSIGYCFAFLPIAVILYSIVPKKFRWIPLLAASYVFFWLISGKLVLYLLFTTVCIYLTGIWLSSVRAECERVTAGQNASERAKAQKACACNARARARAHHHIHGRRVRRVYRNAHRGVRRLHHPAVGRRVRVSAGGRGG